MKPFSRPLLRGFLLAAAVAVGLAACDRGGPEPATPPQPRPDPGAAAAPEPATGGDETAEMPALRVTTVDGKPWDLAGHRGQWVVVNYWATWCAPCLKEMPDLSALDAMRAHVDVIGLAYEDIEPGALQAFLAEHPVVYPIAIVDVYAPPADFATPRGLPTTYLVAPDGKVARHFLGPVTAADIDAAIAEAGGPKAG